MVVVNSRIFDQWLWRNGAWKGNQQPVSQLTTSSSQNSLMGGQAASSSQNSWCCGSGESDLTISGTEGIPRSDLTCGTEGIPRSDLTCGGAASYSQNNSVIGIFILLKGGATLCGRNPSHSCCGAEEMAEM